MKSRSLQHPVRTWLVSAILAIGCLAPLTLYPKAPHGAGSRRQDPDGPKVELSAKGRGPVIERVIGQVKFLIARLKGG